MLEKNIGVPEPFPGIKHDLTNKPRILFFIGNLASGGKERRMIELLTYLKSKGNYEMMVVLTTHEIHYAQFYNLNIPVICMEKKWAKNDPFLFFNFYQIARKFKPHIIHTWGRKQTFYTLPTVLLLGIPLINGQITAAPPRKNINWMDALLDVINFRLSKVILSNSKAGIEVFGPPRYKSRVIYNGINLKRFENLPSVEKIKEKYRIYTPYTVVMVASFSPNKDYDLFYEVAKMVTKNRKDITFIGVGGVGFESNTFERLSRDSSDNPQIIFIDGIEEVEALVNACDIGVLFSNIKVHGEGISNAIMEYMSLSKPVVANDAGGTKEIVCHSINGYLLETQTVDEIHQMIIELIDHKEKRYLFGMEGRKKIEREFSLESMGEAFIEIYQNALEKKAPNLSPIKKV